MTNLEIRALDSFFLVTVNIYTMTEFVLFFAETPSLTESESISTTRRTLST